MAMRIGTPLPDLSGATEWVNGNAGEALEQVKGSPTLIHFWSLSCGMCKENLPRVSELKQRHKVNGLKVISVHMPRYPADADVPAVFQAAAAHGISEPCAIDNLHRLRDAFGNEAGFVPAYYLFDGEGKLKCYAAGERGIHIVSAALERLLR